MATRKSRIAIAFVLMLSMVSFFSVPASVFAESAPDPLVPGPVGSYSAPGDVQIEKSAQTTSDPTQFLVTLNVQGKDKIVSVKTDIVLVLDKSNSMKGTKLTNAKNAAKGFVNLMLPSGNVKNQIGLVAFSDSTAVTALTPTASTLNTKIDAITAGGGTNLQKALNEANTLLASSTATNKYMVVLSDGAPTYSYTGTAAMLSSDIPSSTFKITAFNTTVKGSGNSYTFNSYNVNNDNKFKVSNHGLPTISRALLIKNATPSMEIFTIGCELGTGTPNATAADAKWVLQNVATKAADYFDVSHSSDLADAFGSISDSITAAAKDSVVTDPMGDMVSYVGLVGSPSQGLAAYNATTKILTWTVGDVSEGTPATLTYKVQLNVTDPDFVTGTWYPLNGTTTIDYTDINSAHKTLTYLIPEATATAPEKYSVKYVAPDSNGGTIPSDITKYLKDATVTVKSEEPTRTGYDFTGWKIDDAGSILGATFSMPGKDVTLYAQWEKQGDILTYSVTYVAPDSTGGTIPADITEYPKDASVAVKSEEPTRTGYAFLGWIMGDGTTILHGGDTFDMPGNNVTLYAQWRFIPEGQFSLTTSVVGNGSIDPSEGYHAYSEYTTEVAITADAASGWHFTGWNDGEGYTVPDSDGNVTIDGNIYVEAIFAKTHHRNPTPPPIEPTPTPPEIIIPEEPAPAAPVVTPPQVVIDEPVPAAPLPKTGGLDPSFLYGLGALLAGSGIVLKRRKK